MPHTTLGLNMIKFGQLLELLKKSITTIIFTDTHYSYKFRCQYFWICPDRLFCDRPRTFFISFRYLSKNWTTCYDHLVNINWKHLFTTKQFLRNTHDKIFWARLSSTLGIIFVSSQTIWRKLPHVYFEAQPILITSIALTKQCRISNASYNITTCYAGVFLFCVLSACCPHWTATKVT